MSQSRRDFNRQHEEFEPRHQRFDIHPRFRRQYYGMNGGGMGGGMGMGMMGGMGGMGQQMGGMGQQMGGMGQQMFPGVMQSSKNSWGSFSSQREGGFNNQQQSLIMG
ncbi:unnamed protein product, partial [Mesorhabditis belari]|uniref:Uncharacterized protein n=1 Tax=Mesorhabditis belari TaxID=2138241 RepID=A0AAF3JBF9_9BILA